MKKTLLAILLLSTANAFALGVNLSEQGVMSVDNLVDMGAEHVQCAQTEPRCILMGTGYGIQYIGQTIKDVVLTNTTDGGYAASQLKRLKAAGFCK
ncbi:MAG: hypothetical protein HON90_17340 [Halobacteriovoraceae bacterium]|jgi:hypothetical protein|nr:hypothetical protein [Halobacteriovoraceae bacterium]